MNKTHLTHAPVFTRAPACVRTCVAAFVLSASALAASPAFAQNLFLDGPSVRPPNTSKTTEFNPQNQVGHARNPLVGKIVWVDKAGCHAVAWLDSPNGVPVVLPPAPVSAVVPAPSTTAAPSTPPPAAADPKTPVPAAEEPRSLVAIGAALQPLALLRIASHHPGERAAGLVVERGTVRPGMELVLPSKELVVAPFAPLRAKPDNSHR
jgi:hypothetical protein